MSLTRERTPAKAKQKARSIDLDETPKAGADPELDALIVSVYTKNLAKNKANNEYDKERAKLLKTMKEKKLKERIVAFVMGGQTVTLNSVVATGTSDKANIEKLFKLVGQKTFMKIVSASKKAIVDLAGEAVFTQVKETVEGEENVSVAVVKE